MARGWRFFGRRSDGALHARSFSQRGSIIHRAHALAANSITAKICAYAAAYLPCTHKSPSAKELTHRNALFISREDAMSDKNCVEHAKQFAFHDGRIRRPSPGSSS
jgi:hypothetical protein